MGLLIRYFDWLQKDNPKGRVERFPELKEGFETSVPGIYCIGDLTGVPLINLAADSGRRLVAKLRNDAIFTRSREKNRGRDVLDLVIIGAGPAGLSCAIEARRAGMSFKVLEATRPFNTIHNFPARKPIHIAESPDATSPFSFKGDTKEALLEELMGHPALDDLPIVQNASVRSIEKKDGYFLVLGEAGNERALRVVVAIGKTGNPRQLGVPGEELPKVYTRLIDPMQFSGGNILVVGGGDSALEAALSLTEAGNTVPLSYRGATFSRPKRTNIDALTRFEKAGRVSVNRGSSVARISEKEVVLNTKEGEKRIANDAVLSLIGTEIPISFFNRSHIRLENERGRYDYLVLSALLLFACLIYFGKSASPTPIASFSELWTVPKALFALPFYKMIKGLMAWIGLVGFLGVAVPLVVEQLRSRKFLSTPWERFKWIYWVIAALLFLWVHIDRNLFGEEFMGLRPSGWYAAMYSLTILVFGLRRMHRHPTPYIKKQTWTLVLIQVFPLFLLPVFILPFLGEHHLLSEWVVVHIFPNGSFWRAYGIILGWPLFLYNLASGQPCLFWLVYSIAQTFIVIPFIVYRFGKGAYCGWICSCGALAETLGDEHRAKSPHGPTAKKWENAGQVVLLFATLVTALALIRTYAGVAVPGASILTNIYALVVDLVFAGVLGVGLYFTFSGRIWCRFLCPLAALMHVYARFSRYRIFSKKERCISCGICTRVCHMGIDVMGFANRGIPMNDVECVRCSACIINCPMDVLAFGAQFKADPRNTLYREQRVEMR